MAQRAKFEVSGNEVTVSFAHPLTGDRTVWTFTAPQDGGYVMERTVYGDLKQVCTGLAATGETLYLDGGCRLVDLIRREFNRFKRSFKR